jgi:hypothetical protein
MTRRTKANAALECRDKPLIEVRRMSAVVSCVPY